MSKNNVDVEVVSSDKDNLRLQLRKITRKLRSHAGTSLIGSPGNGNGVSRSSLASFLGNSYDGDRDLYEILGRKKSLTVNDFYAAFLREDIATAVVTAPVDATWTGTFEVLEDRDGDKEGMSRGETAFDKKVKRIFKRLKVSRRIKTLDILTGLGEFGCLFIGWGDNRPFEKPVAPRPNGVHYLRPFSQKRVEIESLEGDKNSPRYGKPLMYRICFDEQTESGNKLVHWTRVIHVVENPLEDDTYGTPRLEKVYNRLADIQLIASGSAEMFWRGAFPGMAFIADDDVEITPENEEDMAEEIEDFVHNLKRYLNLQGVKPHEFKPVIADPTGHLDVQVTLVSSATRIPKRRLLGSESGELASSQDERNWLQFIKERRENYAEPEIVLELVDRFMKYGILPNVEYKVVWPDLVVQNEKEKAAVAELVTRALAEYARSQIDRIITPEDYLINVIGIDSTIIKRMGIKKRMEDLDEESLWMDIKENGNSTVPIQDGKEPARDRGYLKVGAS